MKDCLVTKLKAVVDNPDLLKVDEMKIRVYNPSEDTLIRPVFNTPTSIQITFKFSSPVTFEYQGTTYTDVTEKAVYVNGGTTQNITVPAGAVTDITFNHKEYLYELANRTTTSEIGLLGMYSVTLRDLTLDKASKMYGFYMSNFETSAALRLFIINNYENGGDIAAFANHPALDYFFVNNDSGNQSGIYGDVAALKDSVNLRFADLSHTEVEGDLDAVLDYFAAHRTQSADLIIYLNNKITLTGKIGVGNRIHFSGGSWSVTVV